MERVGPQFSLGPPVKHLGMSYIDLYGVPEYFGRTESDEIFSRPADYLPCRRLERLPLSQRPRLSPRTAGSSNNAAAARNSFSEVADAAEGSPPATVESTGAGAYCSTADQAITTAAHRPLHRRPTAAAAALPPRTLTRRAPPPPKVHSFPMIQSLELQLEKSRSEKRAHSLVGPTCS